ncbi:hypothetical protein D3C72_1211960 [compost metagenome]
MSLRFSLTRQSVFLAVVAAALALPGAAALAQDVPVAGTPVRVIPADAPMARMVMAMPTASTPLTAKLDSKTVATAPGLRVFSTETQLLNPVVIAGKKLPVRYKLDLYGQRQTAWVLTDAEVKEWKASH